MAKTFKFRVWDKTTKEFTTRGIAITLDGKLLKLGQPVQNEDNYLIQPFTGMKDKYDKDLYEEDIIEHTIAKGGTLTQEIGSIRYNVEQAAFCFDTSLPLLQLFSIRKIGNPYENPILCDLHLKNKS